MTRIVVTNNTKVLTQLTESRRSETNIKVTAGGSAEHISMLAKHSTAVVTQLGLIGCLARAFATATFFQILFYLIFTYILI